MRRLSCILTIFAICIQPSLFADAVFDPADALYDEGSYEKAAQAYAQIEASGDFDKSKADWLTWRLADARWRSLASTRQSSQAPIERQRQVLLELAGRLIANADSKRPPQLWAEVQESIGDSYWNRNERDFHQAWSHYEKALDWWAGSTGLAMARVKYLNIIEKAWDSTPGYAQPVFQRGRGSPVPVSALLNALKVADTRDAKAKVHAMLALTYYSQGHGAYAQQQARPNFEAAIADGEGQDWLVDVLYFYAQWTAQLGASYYDDNGNWRTQGDPAAALPMYERIIRDFEKGDTRLWLQAKRQIEQLRSRDLFVNVSHNFLPELPIEFQLRQRNVEDVRVDVYAVSVDDIAFPDTESTRANRNWWERVALEGKDVVYTWRQEQPVKPYTYVDQSIRIPDGLDAGFYIVKADGRGASARAWLIVSETAVVAKTTGEGALEAFVVDAQSGEPLEAVELTAWFGQQESRVRTWQPVYAETGADGFARLAMPAGEGGQWMLFAESAEGPAVIENGWMHRSQFDPQWRIYAFTDRPAYRPTDTVQWKFTARIREAMASYSMPTGQAIDWRIVNPRGDEAASGLADLNAYGSAWGALELSDDMPLGMYRIEFRQGGASGRWIGGEQLFRLEEYKLPEFKVSVFTESVDGDAGTAFRLGEPVTVNVQSEYYFGGAVDGAEVEVVVRQQPFYHWWHPVNPLPWSGVRDEPFHRRYGPGQVVQRKMLTTDERGQATFTIETPGQEQKDLQYTIEARVVDASRREVIGTASIKVTRQPYYAYLRPSRMLYRPGEQAEITVKTLNANNDPVSVKGRLRLTRERWQRIWLGPDGEKITGEEYKRRKADRGLFSKTLDPGDWTLLREGYDVEELKVETLQTDAKGETRFAFDIADSGYYRAYWVSKDERGYPIKADTAIWASDDATRNVGYHGPLKIIADKKTFRAGQSTPVMLHTPNAGSFVWFTVEADGLLESRIVKMEGNTHLLQLGVTDAWIPNVRLAALTINDLRQFEDTVDVPVPPVAQVIDVTITPNAEHYEPRASAGFTIQTKDHLGNPIPAELAFSVFDESVLYIQPELAGDMRAFFYGDERGITVNTNGSLATRRFYEKPPESRSGVQRMEEDSGFGAGQLQLKARSSAQTDSFAAGPQMMGAVAESAVAMDAANETGQSTAAQPAVTVRSDFRATAFWQPGILTGRNGQTVVDFNLPDSLTTWQAQAWAVGMPSRFGTAKTSIKTRLPLIARLQTPRFLVEGDTAVLSGVINNNTGDAVDAIVTLEIKGDCLSAKSAEQSVRVPPMGSARVDFPVSAIATGDAHLELGVRGGVYADAMTRELSVYERGIEKLLVQSGKMVTNELSVSLDMPPHREGHARFGILLSPSLATTMLDALPYLADYPYGCVEQTMSRFLPAIIVKTTLADLGLDADSIMSGYFGGMDNKTPPAAHGLRDLDTMVDMGLERLYDQQRDDGGWGWWKGSRADLYMSAYVVWGLTLAEQAGVRVDTDALKRGRHYLDAHLVDAERQPDLRAWMLHALVCRFKGIKELTPSRYEARAFADLWKGRDHLSAYARALLTLSAVYLEFEEEAATLARNLANGVLVDMSPQSSALAPDSPVNSAELTTAHWGLASDYYNGWQGGIESTAFAVMALLAANAESELRAQAVHWLVQNRHGAQWSNTRDTAITVLALSHYITASGVLDTAGEFSVLVNGEPLASYVITDANRFERHLLDIPAETLIEGENVITFKRLAGDAPLYFSAQASFFTLENPIAAAGNGLFVARDYYRIHPVPTLLDGYQDQKEALVPGHSIDSGDRVEVVLTLEAKNDLEYLVFEDLKPAGLEAVELQSGRPVYARELAVEPDAKGGTPLPAEDAAERYTGRQVWIYQELRDRKIANFADRLPQGFWEIRYTLRAETPGMFTAQPTLAHAMYIPDIRGNSASSELSIQDAVQ